MNAFNASRPVHPTFRWVLRVLIWRVCARSARKARGIHQRVGYVKRFTETTKWDDPWFMDLPLKYKLFWLYICDKCDNAGAWQPNIRLATAQIGESLELAEVLRVFSERIVQLDDGKLFITKFIPFQYGNLSPNCRAHIPILNNIEKLRVSKGYPKGIHTLVEKETEKDKEKKKGSAEGKQAKARPKTIEEVEDFCESIGLQRKDGSAMWFRWESNGYGDTKDWRAKIRQWKIEGYHSSQKQSGNGQRAMSAFEIEKRLTAITAEINATFKRNGGQRVPDDGIDNLKQRRDELKRQLTT